MPNKSLNEKAYNVLLKRIITIEYEPGTLLNEVSLVSDLGISRTPIHSACIRLEREHLVELLPKKGFRVTDIDAQTIRDIHDLRDLIEPYAIRTAGRQLDKTRLMDYLNKFSDENTPRNVLYETDTLMHMDFIKQTGNRLLFDYFSSLKNHFERISNICGKRDKKRIYESNQEHINLLKALLVDDIPGAIDALEEHLHQSRKAAYRILLLDQPNISFSQTISLPVPEKPTQ